MRTEDLIAQLAAEPAEPPRMSIAGGAGLALALGAVLAVAMYMWDLGPRPGLGAVMMRPVVAAKTVLPLILALLSVVLVLRAARPGAQPGAVGRLAWLVPAVVVALFLWAFATAPLGQRMAMFLGHSIRVCLPAIVILSTPMLVGLLTVLRRGAPEHPMRCGALAGLAAAGFATALYSTFCTEDTPLFYSVWYSLGVLIVTAVGAVAGGRLLRW